MLLLFTLDSSNSISEIEPLLHIQISLAIIMIMRKFIKDAKKEVVKDDQQVDNDTENH